MRGHRPTGMEDFIEHLAQVAPELTADQLGKVRRAIDRTAPADEIAELRQQLVPRLGPIET